MPIKLYSFDTLVFFFFEEIFFLVYIFFVCLFYAKSEGITFFVKNHTDNPKRSGALLHQKYPWNFVTYEPQGLWGRKEWTEWVLRRH
jgi:hypothetical protein